MKKKQSFFLHTAEGNEILVPKEAMCWALKNNPNLTGEEGNSKVCIMGDDFYVQESLSEIANLLEETEE